MVYIDDARNNFGRMKMCHMIADTSQELHEVAGKIGVNLKWIQKQNTAKEHYDVCLSKKKIAMEYYGVKEVNQRELVEVIRRKRAALLSNVK